MKIHIMKERGIRMKKKNICEFFKTQISHLIVPLIMIVLGIFCVLLPGSAINFTVKLIGILFVIAGIIMAGTLIARFTSFVMSSAIALFVIGILCLAIPGQIASIVVKLLGIVIIVNSSMRIHDAYIIRGRSDGFTAYIINDILTLIIGIVLLFVPLTVASAVVVVIGIVLLVLGISNLITAYKVYKDGKYINDNSDVVWEE